MTTRLLRGWVVIGVVLGTVVATTPGFATSSDDSGVGTTDEPVIAPQWFEGSATAPGLPPRVEPGSVGLDEVVLAALIEEAERTETDALIVIKDGRTAVERYFGGEVGPIETMSVTKSVVSLAVGMLLDEGKIDSLDAPLSTWFPEWSEGEKAAVTLRHVLTHTSGLEHRMGARVLNAQDDRLAFVRESPLTEPPGTTFSYNNEATQLLSGVIEAAAGEPVDAYLDRRLFQPMGIADWSWERDPAGNAQTFYGLSLRPADLALIGLLMLDAGRWEGDALISEDWVRQATAPGGPLLPHYGLLWWIRRDSGQWVQTPDGLATLREAGFEGADALTPLIELPFDGAPAYWLEAGALLEPDARKRLADLAAHGILPTEERRGDPIGYYADGWLGQALVIYPEQSLVAVRMHRTAHGGDEQENERCGFRGFLRGLQAAMGESR